MKTLSVTRARGIREHASGLLGAQKPFALLLHTRFGIHTFGMRFPIDVVILSTELRIMRVKKNFSPNRIFFWNPSFPFILELPVGTIEKKKLSLHEQVSLRYIDAV